MIDYHTGIHDRIFNMAASVTTFHLVNISVL